LDGLRAFASVIVVVYHCGMFTGLFSPATVASGRFAMRRAVLNGFWSGIDIFFVLSGFLIGRILMSDLSRNGMLSYRSFLVRRAFRIFPAYYLVLTLSVLVLTRLPFPYAFVLFGTSDRTKILAHSWANYLYVNNYFYPGAAPNPFSWGWSLCVEEHFYLILPPLLVLVYRLRSKHARAALLLGCVASAVAARAVQYAYDPSLRLLDGLYYASHNRFDEIFVGVLIAHGFVSHYATLRRVVERCGHAVWMTGVACIAVVWCAGGLEHRGQFAVVWQFLVMAVGSGLLVLNGLFLPNAVTRILSHPVGYFLARVSYGTYLVHPFVLFALLGHFGRLEGPVLAMGGGAFALLCTLVFGIATIVASVLFVALERPLLDRGMVIAARYRFPASRALQVS
jgi:peptidoglycan/LPS O-acetylase OafA/YrhL